jgi:hypothetical protein
MKTQFFRSKPFAYAMHVLLPGMAHVLYREYLFGIFIFLIMQLGAILLVVSFLVQMPAAAKWILLGLPVLFYVFSFFDLHRTIDQKRDRIIRNQALLVGAVLFAVVFQTLAPIAPGNFLLRNRPEFFRGQSNDYSPIVTRGGFSFANRLAYSVDIPLMNRPIFHTLPERFDLVRYVDESGEHRIGLVVGLPQEEVECSDGLLSASGAITPLPRLGGGDLTGSWPLTMVDGYSILIANVKLGVVSAVSPVGLSELVGRVGRLVE